MMGELILSSALFSSVISVALAAPLVVNPGSLIQPGTLLKLQFNSTNDFINFDTATAQFSANCQKSTVFNINVGEGGYTLQINSTADGAAAATITYLGYNVAAGSVGPTARPISWLMLPTMNGMVGGLPLGAPTIGGVPPADIGAGQVRPAYYMYDASQNNWLCDAAKDAPALTIGNNCQPAAIVLTQV